MPNGKGFPQCYECSNFVLEKQCCKIHQFVFPCVSYEVLCRDYIGAHDYSAKTDEKIKELEKNCLFYYSYASKLDYVKLGDFKDLQQKVYQIYIKEDRGYKWILEVCDWHQGLKEKEKIRIVYAKKEERFLQKALNEEILPSVTRESVDYITSFEKDERKKELLRKAMLPATEKALRRLNAFVPEDKRNNFLELFISENYDLSNYRKVKNKFQYFPLTVFLEQINDGSYEIRGDLYYKRLMKEIEKK